MSLFKAEEMKRGRVDDSQAFYSKLRWLTCLCFGGHINFSALGRLLSLAKDGFIL